MQTSESKRRTRGGIARLVRRLERERRPWMRTEMDAVPTEIAWRARVAEGLRLAQTAIKRGV